MTDQNSIARAGRPRSPEADRSILDAARELLIDEGFSRLRLEHVAARANVGKATLYRRWSSKEELAEAVLEDLAQPAVAVPEEGDTRSELLAVVMNTIRALIETPFGPVIRALLSQIAINPKLGELVSSHVVHGRRQQIAAVVERGIGRGDLRSDTDIGSAAEVLVGPIYYRLIFGGSLDRSFADHVVDGYLQGHGTSGPPDG